MNKVAASLLSVDFGDLSKQVSLLKEAGVDILHFDVMDGHFVPNITMGPDILRTVRKTTDLFLDVHLMIEKPELYISDFIEAGADSITVHSEACLHLHRVIQQIKNAGCKVAVAINPATPVVMIQEVLPFVDMVLVMSVNPGFGGQKFIETVLKKVREIKSLSPNVIVEIDGGINLVTSKLARDAGVDILVSGSYLVNSSNWLETVKALRGN